MSGVALLAAIALLLTLAACESCTVTAAAFGATHRNGTGIDAQPAEVGCYVRY